MSDSTIVQNRTLRIARGHAAGATLDIERALELIEALPEVNRADIIGLAEIDRVLRQAMEDARATHRVLRQVSPIR